MTNHKLLTSTNQYMTINYLFYQFLSLFSSYIENPTTTKQQY